MPRVSASHERERRDQIVAAAAMCFARHGFAETAMPEIAAAAGLSVGALYRYYPGKEELFLAVIAERVAVYNEAVFAALRTPGPPVERIIAALRSLQRLLHRQRPEDARLSLELWSRAHDVPQLGAWLQDARRRRLYALREVLVEARLSGEVRRDLRTNEAAAFLLALADGLVVQRACAPFQPAGGDPVAEAERVLAVWPTP